MSFPVRLCPSHGCLLKGRCGWLDGIQWKRHKYTFLMWLALFQMFLPAMEVQTKSGKLLVPGQVIRTDSGLKFVPGEIVSTEHGGALFVPGLVLDSPEGAKFLRGEVVETADGPRLLSPGNCYSAATLSP